MEHTSAPRSFPAFKGPKPSIAGPSSGSNGTSNKVNLIKRNMQSAVPTKPKLKIDGKGQNLLPSKKMVAPPSMLASEVKTGGKSKKVGDPPTGLQRNSVLKNNCVQLRAAYSNYLMNYLNKVLAIETVETQEACQLDELALKCTIDAPAFSARFNKIYWSTVLIGVYKDWELVKDFRECVSDLVDATEYEVLKEIVESFATKYDDLPIEGATVDGPIFQNHEVERLLQKLKTCLGKDADETTVLGFCAKLSNTLKDLIRKHETLVSDNEKIEAHTMDVLEVCSLKICSEAVQETIKRSQKGRQGCGNDNEQTLKVFADFEG